MQRDNQLNITIAEESRKIAASSAKIAEESRRDSAAMKAIAVLTLTFLPGTTVAVSSNFKPIAAPLTGHSQFVLLTMAELLRHVNVRLESWVWRTSLLELSMGVFRSHDPVDLSHPHRLVGL
jgi:hypothetical protein